MIFFIKIEIHFHEDFFWLRGEIMKIQSFKKEILALVALAVLLTSGAYFMPQSTITDSPVVESTGSLG